jgi:6-pyruvoyltetrahydropterin/6-carboxytetrahydropterin synthase
MIRLTRRYTFSASHRLHSVALSDAENRALYGKCNNPYGHGHDYEVELTVGGEVDTVTGRVVDLARLDALADEQILTPFRYRDLNRQVAAFKTTVPTTENLAIEVDRRLRAQWSNTFGESGLRLEKVRIRETDRNICDITGQA